MKKKSKRLLWVFLLTVTMLMIMSSAAFAATVYLTNGEFNSGTAGWSKWPNWTSHNPQVGSYDACYEGQCYMMTNAGYYIYQTLTVTHQYLIVGAWITDNIDGRACVSVSRSGSFLGSACSTDEIGWAGWVSSCINVVEPGLVNIRLVPTSSGSMYVDNVFFESVASCPPTIEPPEPHEEGSGIPSIPITATCPISVSIEISGTEVITNQQFPANLVQNYSFESGRSSWDIDPPSVSSLVISATEGGVAHSGDGFAYTSVMPQTRLSQFIYLPEAEDGYLVGAFVKFIGSGSGVDLNLYVGPNWLNMGIHEEGEYKLHEVQFAYAQTGQLRLDLILPSGSPTFPYAYYVDDLYVIPVSGTISGPSPSVTVDCSAVEEFYGEVGGTPPPVEYSPVQNVGGLPLPINGAGSVCYDCYFPSGRGVEMAIAWLGCIIRNLFSCSLRNWLQEIVNAIIGVFTLMGYQTNALLGSGQGFATWSGVSGNGFIGLLVAMYANIGAILGGGGVTVDGGMGIWEFLYLLVDTVFVRSIEAITDLLYSIASLIGVIITAVSTVLYFILVAVGIILTPLVNLFMIIFTAITTMLLSFSYPPLSAGEFAAISGYSIETELFNLFLVSVAVVDEWVIAFKLYWFFWIAIGFVGFSIVEWLIKQFSQPVLQ